MRTMPWVWLTKQPRTAFKLRPIEWWYTAYHLLWAYWEALSTQAQLQCAQNSCFCCGHWATIQGWVSRDWMWAQSDKKITDDTYSLSDRGHNKCHQIMQTETSSYGPSQRSMSKGWQLDHIQLKVFKNSNNKVRGKNEAMNRAPDNG